MSLVGEPFGNCWGTSSPRVAPQRPSQAPAQPQAPAPASDLFQELESFGGQDRARYDQEFAKFRELLDRVKGMDQQPGDRNPKAGEVAVNQGRQEFRFGRTAEGFELSHKASKANPPGTFSIAPPACKTTRYEIRPDRVTKTFTDTGSGARETLTLNTQNRTIRID